MKSGILRLVLGFALALAIVPGAWAQTKAKMGSVYDPADFTSLGTLVVGSGQTITINTTNLSVSGQVTATGVLGQSRTGVSTAAVFCFDSIDLQAGSIVNTTGTRPLVLLSKTTANIASNIAVDGGIGGVAGTVTDAGIGGSARCGAFPGSARNVAATIALNGPGRAGLGITAYPSGGAGFGGNGGRGADAVNGGAAGGAYGTSLLPELVGGSGGCGGNRANPDSSGGGGGGGAISIVASGNLTIAAGVTISANGGASGDLGARVTTASGGGGAGGAILLVANSIDNQGTVSARGGNSGNSGTGAGSRSGGGGGGGRVVMLYGTASTVGTINVSGGTVGTAVGALGVVGATGTAVTANFKFPSTNTLGSALDPNDFSAYSLGALNAASGSLFVDTSNVRIGNGTTTQTGVVTASKSGDSLIVAFPFSSIAIASAVTPVLRGDFALGLLSLDSAQIGTSLRMNGDNSITSTALTNARSLLGGFAGGPRQLPTVTTINFLTSASAAGNGPGAGRMGGGTPPFGAGSGGGYGAAGGASTGANGVAGGVAYGNSAVAELLGGSGGGGGSRFGSTVGTSGGGAGGGAILLSAVNTITIDANTTISANGGNGFNIVGTVSASAGGGGSGGAIVLRAATIQNNGALQVKGGKGGDASCTGAVADRAGGGGAGGRIALYYTNLTKGTLSVTGGAAGVASNGTAATESGLPGNAGTVGYMTSGPIYVKSDATGAADGSSWADAFTTVQAGIDLATGRRAIGIQSEVWVAGGTYPIATAVLPTTNTVIRGGYEGVASNRDIALFPTTLQGTGAALHVVAIQSISTATLEGLTIKNGVANGAGHNGRGGGVLLTNTGAGVTFSQCTITSNSAKVTDAVAGSQVIGAGVYMGNAQASFTSCTISSNIARRGNTSIGTYGGGMAIDGAGCKASLTDCVVSDNAVLGDFGVSTATVSVLGGGIYSNLPNSILLRRTQILRNSLTLSNYAPTATQQIRGGGVYIAAPANPVTIDGCVFADNTMQYLATTSQSQVLGGGLMFDGGTRALTMTNTQFLRNAISGGGSGGNMIFVGSGMALGNSTGFSLTNCDFISNNAVYTGLAAGGRAEGAVYLSTGASGAFANCRFASNTNSATALPTLAGQQGAAVSSAGANTNNISFSNCQFVGNKAGWKAGAVYLASNASGKFRFENCLFAGNNGNGSGGISGAIHASTAPMDLINCMFYENRALGMGSAVSFDGTVFNGAIVNNVFLKNRNGQCAVFENAATADPIIVANNAFEGNFNGVYYDNGSTVPLMTTAVQLNAKVPEALGLSNMDGPITLGASPASGVWTAAPAYDSVNQQTALTAATGSFAPGALVGQVIRYNTSSLAATATAQALILANTADTITVAGNVAGNVASGDSFEVVNLMPAMGSTAIDGGMSVGGAYNVPALDITGAARADALGVAPVGGSIVDIGVREFSGPGVLVNPLSINFGNDTATVHNIQIGNGGTSALNYTGAVLGGANPGDFQVNIPAATALAAGTSVTATVQFQPVGSGVRTATLTISSDDPGQPTVVVTLTGTVYGTVIYVDGAATGGNDGSSWADAFTTVQAAVAEAVTRQGFGVNAEIRVAGGTYTLSSPLTISNNNIVIKGGYEAVGSSRDIAAFPSILLGNGTVQHIVSLSNVTTGTLDGLTFMNGKAIGAGNNGKGAGIFASGLGTGVVINACTITSNTASCTDADQLGAGVFLTASSPTFTSCTISNNVARRGAEPRGVQGGGILVGGGSKPAFIDCAVINNTLIGDWDSTRSITMSGAGLGTSSPAGLTITRCRFSGNLVRLTTTSDFPNLFGAGMYLNNITPSMPVITDSVFSDNMIDHQASKQTYSFGGGVSCDNVPSGVSITGCRFENNVIQGNGVGSQPIYTGTGLFVRSTPNMTLTNTDFIGNHALYTGTSAGGRAEAALYLGGGITNGAVTNCDFIGNSNASANVVAVNAGGPAIASVSASNDNVTFSGCRIIGNRAANRAGAAYLSANANGKFRFENCIFAGNTAGTYNGGAILAYSAPLDVVNCLFYKNTGANGSALTLDGTTTGNLVNNLFAGNRGGADVYEYLLASEAKVLEHNAFGGNTAGLFFDKDGNHLYSDAAGVNSHAGAVNNVSGTVKFATALTSGTWSQAPQYDAVLNRTVLTVATAAFTPNALVDQPIEYNQFDLPTTASVVAMIVANTTNTLALAGDVTANVSIGDTFSVLNLHPAYGSIAIDAGAAMGGTWAVPVTDMLGTARADAAGATNVASTVDSGALEFDAPAAAFEPASLNFVMDTATTRTITLRSVGSQPLVYTGAGLVATGANLASFSVSIPALSTLAPGAGTDVKIRFQPVVSGAIGILLQATTNDPDQPLTSAAILGGGERSAARGWVLFE